MSFLQKSVRAVGMCVICTILAIPLTGCMTGPDGQPNHALNQSAMTAATQIAVYEITRKNPGLAEEWPNVIRALDQIQEPTQEYWDLGRDLIVVNVHPAYVPSALLVYSIAETQLKGRFPTNMPDVNHAEFKRYLEAVKTGIKSGMALAQPQG